MGEPDTTGARPRRRGRSLIQPGRRVRLAANDTAGTGVCQSIMLPVTPASAVHIVAVSYEILIFDVVGAIA